MTHYALTRKYGRRETSAEAAVGRTFGAHFVFQVTILLLFLLSFLYVAETNAVLFSERATFKKHEAILGAEQVVTKLEVEAAGLQSAQEVQRMAQSGNMVFVDGVTYVSLSDGSVALAR